MPFLTAMLRRHLQKCVDCGHKYFGVCIRRNDICVSSRPPTGIRGQPRMVGIQSYQQLTPSDDLF